MKRSIIALVVSVAASTAFAGSRDQALKLHNRLAGVPPTEAVLKQMADLIDKGDMAGAAKIAVETENFLRITVRQMATTWTNVDHVIDKPLNDYSATVIGFVANDIDFGTILSADVVYTAADVTPGVPPTGVAVFARNNNTHYENFAALGLPYKSLVSKVQSTLAPLPAAGTAYASGILTSREFAMNYYSAGTNRRAFESVVNTFLCKKLEQLHDVTRPDSYVRRDVDRSPGGNPVEYKNKCAGCHAGMDPLANAFNHIDYIGGDASSRLGNIFYDETTLPAKIIRGADTFPAGYTPTGDNWVNLWTEGQNASIGWKGAPSGDGLKAFGEMLSKTARFDECMAETVFHKVCLHEATTPEEKAALKKMTANFSAGGRKMKGLFVEAGVACAGE